MRKKLLAVVVGILTASLLCGTALAGNHGPIDFTNVQVVNHGPTK